MNNHENETVNKPLGNATEGESLQEDRSAREPFEVDPEFLAKLPTELHPVVRRWGVELFTFCNSAGLIGAGLIHLRQTFALALETISKAPSKMPIARQVDRQASAGLQTLEKLANEMAARLAKEKGWDLADIRECQEDIGRAATLAQVGSQASGIILPH